jgi:glycosyltransferase involved in cell wall biosynthesis
MLAVGSGPVSASDLVVRLESPLPAALPEGRRTAVFVAGICFRPGAAATRPELLVDGVPHPPGAWGMPRPDVPEAGSSGFWGILPVRAGSELAVRAGDQLAPLGSIGVAPARPPVAADTGLIAVCIATFEPDIALFETQIGSLRAQTDERWVCVISDDASDPEHFSRIQAAVSGDDRFVLSRSDDRLGFYRNFERVLTLAPAEAGLIALCDQDDRWYPDKLATLRAALRSAQMVYSDQRLVDARGRVLRETLWAGRRNNHTDLVSLLVANSITGAATLLRREVAELSLPFPDTPGLPFHDHWLGLVALAAGDIAYVDRPLYDYVQHRGAFFGEVTHGGRLDGPRAPLLRGGRAAYFRGYLARAVLAQDLLVRCEGRLTRAKRRDLERFAAAERSPLAAAWLAARPLRTRATTLGSESELMRGVLWRWAIGALARYGRGGPDASMPDVLSFQQRRLRRWRARV